MRISTFMHACMRLFYNDALTSSCIVMWHTGFILCIAREKSNLVQSQFEVGVYVSLHLTAVDRAPHDVTRRSALQQ